MTVIVGIIFFMHFLVIITRIFHSRKKKVDNKELSDMRNEKIKKILG